MTVLLRAILAVGLAAAALAWLEAPAAAKEGVEASLETPVPVDAEPGEQFRLSWTVGFEADGGWQPISDAGSFVRLLSLTDAEPSTATGSELRPGHYMADVTVPEGGIGGVEIGVPTGTRDLLFPITNSPFPSGGNALDTTSQEVSVPGEDPTMSGSLPVWVIVVLVSALATGIVVLGAVILRRRGLSGSSEGNTASSA